MPAIETTGIRDDVRLNTQLRRIAAILRHDLPRLCNEVISQWGEHRVPRLGASLAFYTLLSLAPLLVIVVAVAGAFFGRDAVEGQLVWQIQDIVGHAGAETVQSLLKSTQQPGAGTLASILGSIALAVGATSGIAELRDGLNVIWCVPRREESALKSIVSMLRDKWLAFVAVLGIGFFLLVSVVFSTVLSWVTGHFSNWEITAALLRFADLGISFVVIALLFTLIYKWLPDLRLEWRDVIPGALITTVLFSIGRYFIGFYLGRSSYASLYGAAGSLVVLLVWVYYSAQIFYLGVEFARAWAQAYGSKPCDRIGREVKLAEEAAKPAPAPPSEPLIKVP